MLRIYFGEPRREDEGGFKEVRQAVSGYLKRVRNLVRDGRIDENGGRRLSVWAKGFVAALDELEQSVYASGKYVERVHSRFQEQMNQDELDDYHRHVYFFKNGFIRVFAVLDKLGTFLNEELGLKTEKIKHRFSYFTVLRRMEEMQREPELLKTLIDIKTEYRKPLDRLRKMRNIEVHSINTELLDDMEAHFAAGQAVPIENLKLNMDDLRKGYDMVWRSMHAVFQRILPKQPSK